MDINEKNISVVRQYCEDSLRRLRIDSIPLFYQHRFDRDTPIEEVADCISNLIREGKVQRWGLRQNTRIVNVLQQFGRTRGMTSAQVALAWLLNKAPFIVPIPGTTKTAHFEENLHTLDFLFSDSEWAELEQQVAAIPVVGDRYGADQQKQVM